MLGQCCAILLLKWQLVRNTWNLTRMFSLVAGIVLVLGGLALAALLSVGAFFLGTSLDPPLKLESLLIFDALLVFFLFLWLWGLLFELQRDDIIDFRKMLYLPVSLTAVFGLNFLASLLSPSLLFFVPCSMALILGLTTRHGMHMLAALPLALFYFLALGAWAYYVRGILAILMENKRRRRLILTMIPVAIVVISQTPNMIMQARRQQEAPQQEEQEQARKEPPNSILPPNLDNLERRVTGSQADFERWVLTSHAVLPVAWLPLGLWRLAQGQAGAAAFASGGLILFSALGLGLGYRSTVRHYLGAGTGKERKRQPSPKRERETRPGTLTLKRLPLLDDDSSAMTMACFLTFLRHPNVRMMLVMPLVLGTMLLVMHQNALGEDGDHRWLSVAVVVWPLLNFSVVLFNVFGVDNQAFRGLVLLPTARHKYLLAKNLALFPFAGGLALVFVAAAALLLRLPLNTVFIAVLQVFQLYLTYCIIGNLLSVFMPYRLARDTMRPGRRRPLQILIGILTALLMGVMVLPGAFCLYVDDLAADFGYGGLPLGILGAAALLAATVLVYRVALRHTGDLLLAREHRVLGALAVAEE